MILGSAYFHHLKFHIQIELGPEKLGWGIHCWIIVFPFIYYVWYLPYGFLKEKWVTISQSVTLWFLILKEIICKCLGWFHAIARTADMSASVGFVGIMQL
jgi:hypothetical protein